jgi:hypothetical protein
MSTLRVNQVIFNDGNNAYFTQANTNNVSLYVNGTEALAFYTNGAVVFSNTNFKVGGTNVISSLAAAYNQANTSVQNNATTLITTGYTVTPFNAGANISSYGTWTPDAANGNYQFGTSNGAVTIGVPAANSAIDFLLTNGVAANTITYSGYTVQSGGTGDTYATTSGNKYLISIRKINSVATYVIKALQ